MTAKKAKEDAKSAMSLLDSAASSHAGLETPTSPRPSPKNGAAGGTPSSLPPSEVETKRSHVPVVEEAGAKICSETMTSTANAGVYVGSERDVGKNPNSSICNG